MDSNCFKILLKTYFVYFRVFPTRQTLKSNRLPPNLEVLAVLRVETYRNLQNV